MGVLRCDRAGCEAVMCDRHSYEHGYLCHTCFRELVERGLTAPEEIEEFMATRRARSPTAAQSVREYLETVFLERD